MAKTFEVTPGLSDRQTAAISSAKKRNAKKSARQKARHREQRELDTCRLTELIQIPPDVSVIRLDDDRAADLRACPGYQSNKGYLRGLLKGQEISEAIGKMRTPWSEGSDPTHFRGMVASILCDDRMIRREEDFLRKFGPYFLKSYHTWCHKVFGVYTRKPNAWDEDTLERAIRKVAKIYQSALQTPLKALHPRQVGQMVNDESSVGFPFFTSNWYGSVEMDGVDTTPFDWGQSVASEMVDSEDYSGLSSHVYTLFTRKGVRGLADTGKATERPVQCSPLVERFLGLGLQKPFMKFQQSLDFSRGLNGVEVMPGPMREAFSHYEAAFEADYSNYDASISPYLIDRVMMDVVAPCFREEDRGRVSALARFYREAKLWTPDGLIYSEDGPGLLSGSMLTNVIGTVLGHIAWEYFVERLEQRGLLLNYRAFGYGDDLCVHFTPLNFQPAAISEYFCEVVRELGLTAHPDKQYVSWGDKKEVSFLGNVFFDDDRCDPVYPIARGCPKMFWYEHFNRIGDAGDHQVNYSGELTGKEKLLAGVIGRLDVMRFNHSFRPFVLLVREFVKIRVSDCIKFLPDPSVSPSLSIIMEEEAINPLPPDEEDEEMTPEELAELTELIGLAIESDEGRSILREWKAPISRRLKAMKKKEHLQEERSSRRASLPDGSHDGEGSQPAGSQPSLGQSPMGPEELRVLFECVDAASNKKKRMLLQRLRQLRGGVS